jgi:hypothetical protein
MSKHPEMMWSWHLYHSYIIADSVPFVFTPTFSEQPVPTLGFRSVPLLLAPVFRPCLLSTAYCSLFLSLSECFSLIRQCILRVHLCLVPLLLAEAKVLFCLLMAVVPLGLVMVWGLQASQDPLASDRGAPVTLVLWPFGGERGWA